METALIALLGAALGGTLASYFGVVADRGWAASLSGRSRCDGCGRTLRWFELVPLLSFLALGGRCRTCGAVLPRIHLLRETLGVALGAGAGAAIGLALGR
ncbi:MAG TPA: prepilin peptidase [Candidatus Dormibacteraeota bacterium]|nr:prepilin peptidase [Candidatus Dormibacteraeota bacterium]